VGARGIVTTGLAVCPARCDDDRRPSPTSTHSTATVSLRYTRHASAETPRFVASINSRLLDLSIRALQARIRDLFLVIYSISRGSELGLINMRPRRGHTEICRGHSPPGKLKEQYETEQDNERAHRHVLPP